MDSAVGSNWDDAREELFTSEEILESNRWVSHIRERIVLSQAKEQGGTGTEGGMKVDKDEQNRKIS